MGYDLNLVARKFEEIGARLRVGDHVRAGAAPVRLDVLRDDKGEYFDLQVRPGADVTIGVVDARPEDRHLLLLVREPGKRNGPDRLKYLCGHDERQWFVCGVADAPRLRVTSVESAKEALKPAIVQLLQDREHVSRRGRMKRRNAAYVRQGEWFFVPRPEFRPPKAWLLLRNEPLSRGAGSKPHVAEIAYRIGGEAVYVCSTYPNGITESQYRRLLRRQPGTRRLGWAFRRRGAQVFVMGRVRHPDHKTVRLDGWHEVFLNREAREGGVVQVAFLD